MKVFLDTSVIMDTLIDGQPWAESAQELLRVPGYVRAATRMIR